MINGNGLDEACREHDIEYSKVAVVVGRNVGDKELVHKALKRVFDKDSSVAEQLPLVRLILWLLNWADVVTRLRRRLGRKPKNLAIFLIFCKVSNKICKYLSRYNNVDYAARKAVQVVKRIKKTSSGISHPKACIILVAKTVGWVGTFESDIRWTWHYWGPLQRGCRICKS